MFTSCQTFISESDALPLPGMVYNTSGQPIPDVIITLDDESSFTTDLEGRFIIPDLALGSHQVAITCDGYIPESLEVEYQGMTQILYVKLLSIDEQYELILDMIETADSNMAEEALESVPESYKGDDRYLLISSMIAYHQGDSDKAYTLAESIRKQTELVRAYQDYIKRGKQ